MQKTRKHAPGMNMAIANMHRFTIQLVALMLAIANLMALCLSAISVVAGVVTVTILQFPGAYALWVVAFVIGPLLSLLVESGTLNRLIRVRLMDREIADTKSKMEASSEKLLASVQVPDPNQPNYRQSMKQYRKTCSTIEVDTRKRYKRATRDQRKTKRLALIMAFACAGASAFAGGIFYHIILAGLGQIWDMAASVVFPLVVTGTFISTELNKDEQEATIREGFGGGALAETAIREETKLQAFKSVSSKALAYLDKPEAEQDINKGTRFLVQDILAELNEEARKRTRQRQEAGEFERPTGHTFIEEAATSIPLLPSPTGQDSGQPQTVNRLTTTGQDTTQSDLGQPKIDAQPGPDSKMERTNQPADSGQQEAANDHQTPKQKRAADTDPAKIIDMTGRRSTGQKQTGGQPEAANGHREDATTAKIKAYQIEHPAATQSEMAAAIGVSERTIRRKMAAQRSEESVS